MSEKSKKIKDLLKLLKLEVNDELALEKDFESILKMFDELSKVEILSENSSLSKKQINLNNLREDIATNSEFRKELSGKYFKVPSVSKKD